jgi:hypothetical protein
MIVGVLAFLEHCIKQKTKGNIGECVKIAKGNIALQLVVYLT